MTFHNHATELVRFVLSEMATGVVPEEKGEGHCVLRRCRKAAMFRKKQGGGFYVLLSDWRQLKPCLEILEEAARRITAMFGTV